MDCRRFVLLIFPFLFSCSAALCAQDAVDRWVSDFISDNKVPGVALLVRQDGRVVKMKGYGFSNLEHRVPVNPQTVFQSGSMGKQFTATAVMMLAEEGKLSVDDPVGKYLDVPASWNDIKIRHLLSHTSGLGDYPENFELQKDHTEDEMFQMVKATPLQFAPGEKFSYSNLGFVTLGVLIHKISGKFYGDFLQERIFRPLSMSNTRIINEADIVPNRAAGYVLVDGALKNQKWVAPMVNTTADGSLYLTVEDLAKWDAALEQRKLISAASYRAMWTPTKLNDGTTADYGFGWRIHKAQNGSPLIEHAGAWQGFSTMICRYPEQHLTVVALANRANAKMDDLAHHVAGMMSTELAVRGKN
jgi:CubicO group peptidase (beta-lactamase class C family)